MIKYTKKELEDLYEKVGSVRRVATEIGVPKSTVSNYFKKYNIVIDKKLDIKKAELKKLYKEFGSASRISEETGVPKSTIYYNTDKYNINIKKTRFPYTKEELIELHDKHGSITKVAAALSRSYTTVRYWYSELDVVFNKSGMTIYQEIRETPMSPEQKSLLIGSMLGDGGIWLAPHSKNARLYISHCERQLGYLKWTHSKFKPFSRKITQTEKAGKKMIGDLEVNGSNFYRFYTIAHPDITELFHKYYRDGFKCVDESIIDKVDLISMAVWFGDDGSICRNNKGEPLSCSIATNSFTYKEQVILTRAISKFFKGKIRIVSHSGFYKSEKREDYVIKMSGKDHVNSFLRLIKTVLPECIYYKLS